MKRFILFLISSCAVVFAYAQEEIILDRIPKVPGEAEAKELIMEKPSLFENSFSMGEINRLDKSMFNQPLLPDYSKNLDFRRYQDFSKLSTESFSTARFAVTPFYTNGIVFNQAIYRLSNNFSFGGNSFGAQSAFDKTGINSSIRDMSTKGASVFMQYKVSKNFKVETRVSISSHKSPWEP